MGNRQAQPVSEMLPENHVRIYKNLLAIQSPQTRVQMIDTLLASPEFIESMKRGGLYAHILQYKAAVQRGDVGGAMLPGETVRPPARGEVVARPMSSALVVKGGVVEGGSRKVDQRGNEKGLLYFNRCLEVLGLSDKESLTEEVLKAAYKRAGKKAHPDKGGSEEAFEAVTRAYAYLLDILLRIHGGRTVAGKVEAPSLLSATRSHDADKWKHVEPVKLNPKNLDMNAFNDMFTKTRMADPDDDGYGDWLKDEGGAKEAKKFSGKFNREVFNAAFEEDAGEDQGGALTVQQPSALMMAPTMGVEIGRDRPDDFTAPANSELQYTDLKMAYTKANTFSQQVRGVRVENRSFAQMEAERGSAPAPLTNEEMQRVQQAEQMMLERENARQRRAKEREVAENEYFERMKRLVIANN